MGCVLDIMPCQAALYHLEISIDAIYIDFADASAIPVITGDVHHDLFAIDKA